MHEKTKRLCWTSVRNTFLPVILVWATCFGISLVTSCSRLEASPFASVVYEYVPGPGQWVNNPKFNDPLKVLGAPQGGTVSSPCNESLVTLGDGGHIVVGFDHPIWDDPRNPHGLDFIVFGNPAWVGGDPTFRWQEPAFVEISMDKNGNGLPDDEWYLVLPNKVPGALVGSPAENCDTGYSSTVLRNYAEYTPTLALPPGKTAEEFYTFPDRQSFEGDPSSLLIDEGSGGGDAFDIADAVVETSPGVPAQPITHANIPCFHFMRITDALIGDSAGILGEISAEIDAVSCVSSLTGTTPIGAAKKQSPGSVVALAGKVVSAVFAGDIFIQEEDRSCGIRVRTSAAVEEGDRVAVIGTLADENDEVFLDNARVYVMASGTPPKPLATVGHSLHGTGLSTAGLLVTVWGTVTLSGDDYFFVNDGSLDEVGVRVHCPGLTPPPAGQFAIITGVSIPEKQAGGQMRPALRVRNENDIRILQ